jgi:hypothetical protein
MHSVGSIKKDCARQKCLESGGDSPRSILRLGNAPGRSHRAGWLWPFRHNREKHSAFVPPANPADAPAINVIANGDFSEEAQKFSLNLHGDPCMALRGWTVKVAPATTQVLNRPPDASRVRPGAIWQVGLLFTDPTN